MQNRSYISTLAFIYIISFNCRVDFYNVCAPNEEKEHYTDSEIVHLLEIMPAQCRTAIVILEIIDHMKDDILLITDDLHINKDEILRLISGNKSMEGRHWGGNKSEVDNEKLSSMGYSIHFAHFSKLLKVNDMIETKQYIVFCRKMDKLFSYFVGSSVKYERLAIRETFVIDELMLNAIEYVVAYHVFKQYGHVINNLLTKASVFTKEEQEEALTLLVAMASNLLMNSYCSSLIKIDPEESAFLNLKNRTYTERHTKLEASMLVMDRK